MKRKRDMMGGAILRYMDLWLEECRNLKPYDRYTYVIEKLENERSHVKK